MQYTIQRWASQHIFLARTLLVILHTMLGYIAYFIALNVADHLKIPWSLVFTPLLVSILLLLNFYKKEAPKAVPPLLIALRMLFWFFVGIQLSHFADEKISSTSSAYTSFIAYKAIPETTIKNINTPVNEFLTSWKKLIQRDKKWVKINRSNYWAEALIVLTAITLIIIVAYFGLLISCSLSCNGSESAAILVLALTLLSIIGIIVGATKLVRKSSKGTSNNEKEKEELRQRRQPQGSSKNSDEHKSEPKSQNEKEKEELRQRRQPQGSSKNPDEHKDEPKSQNEREKEELRQQRQPSAPVMPKKDIAPTITKKVETPAVPGPPKKKISPKERRYNKRLDAGIIWAKILTAIVLGGLIIFTILS
jgi:hypothetical protein